MKVLSRGASVGGARRRWPASHGTAEGKVGKGGLGEEPGHRQMDPGETGGMG